MLGFSIASLCVQITLLVVTEICVYSGICRPNNMLIYTIIIGLIMIIISGLTVISLVNGIKNIKQKNLKNGIPTTAISGTSIMIGLSFAFGILIGFITY